MEKELTEMLVREVLGSGGKTVTDEQVRKTMEILDHLQDQFDQAGIPRYSYEHPDYGEMIGKVSTGLKQLVKTTDADDVKEYEEFRNEAALLQRGELVESVNSIIYTWLNKWHTDKDGDFWMFPIHCAIRLIEHFKLRECLPALLEMERQDREFAMTEFDDERMTGMLPSSIYQIATEEDLPLLLDFMREKGIFNFAKADIAAAVSTLPRRILGILPQVQQWLVDAIEIVDKGMTPGDGDEMLLEALFHCCIHTRNVQAKDAIIRLYSKYKIPNLLIPGGANEVRKTIKKAAIGVIREEIDSAEKVYQAAKEDMDDDFFDEDDFDDEDYDDDFDDDDFDDYEEVDDEPLPERQSYAGWASISKAHYLPTVKLRKYILRITLKRLKPEVWREIEVPSNITLDSLARVIILAMGWDEDHLHMFVKGKTEYATNENEFGDGFSKAKDGSKFTLAALLKKVGDSATFEYDYGDSWHHDVKVKKITAYEDGEKPCIQLVGGENACPPDDCGGVFGYQDMLNAIQKNPNGRNARGYYEWLGSKWDATYFPEKETAKALKRLN